MNAMMRASSKGQAAIEYLAIVGIALLLTAPLIVQTQQSAFELQTSYQNGLAKTALNTMEEAAAIVNSQGEPARVTVTVRLPNRINRTNVTDNYLHIRRVSGTDTYTFYNTVSFNVSGSIPTSSGVHRIIATAEEDYVNITVP